MIALFAWWMWAHQAPQFHSNTKMYVGEVPSCRLRGEPIACMEHHAKITRRWCPAHKRNEYYVDPACTKENPCVLQEHP